MHRYSKYGILNLCHIMNGDERWVKMAIEELLPKLIRAGFEGDMRTLESISLTALRKIKKQYPEVSNEIANILSYKNMGTSTYRSIGIQPSPVDNTTRFPLAKIEEPEPILEPILNIDLMAELERFMRERGKSEELLTHGIRPPNSIILFGEPGVGKTYTARWIASKLNMTMITLDLATSISSYLGKTGQNIKSILDYARSFNSVLFIDEFDAIAKRRDDLTDLGELKRIVNVLLKELEEWPSNCIVIAATNHPELLDKAIWRRFDKQLELGMPKENERQKLLKRNMLSLTVKNDILGLIVKLTEGVSAADLCKYVEHVKRRYIIDKEDIEFVLFTELKQFSPSLKSKDKAEICRRIRDYNNSFTVRKIADITGYSASSVQRYLKIAHE